MNVQNALKRLMEGHLAEALTFFQSEKWRNPCYGSLVNLAVAERANSLFHEARNHFREAAIMERNRPEAWTGLGNIATDLGEFTEAVECFGTAATVCHLARIPVPPTTVALGLASSLMRIQQFTTAWPLWEYGRQNQSWFILPNTKPWRGEETNCLLVVCEGGYGDAMLFGRWLPLAKSRCKKIKLLVWDRLVDWRDWQAMGVDEVLPKEQPFSPEGIEYTTSWMSLPAVLGMKSIQDIPADSLRNPLHDWPENSYDWTDHTLAIKRPEPEHKIGFCWRAEENMQLRRTRSIPGTEAEKIIESLSSMGKVYSLLPKGQTLYRAASTADWPKNIIQDESLIDGWARTNDFIRTLKLVVTVDTAVAHLAGLCGVPTMIILPLASGWMWGVSGSASWWYPGTQLLRNDHPSKWNIELINADAR